MTEARKIHLAKGNVQRPINSAKASGDAGGKPQAKHKNKDKIPKSLRYDLENALVGLCDVWFGEIKPYLVRNNVKVHVHDTEAGGGDREALAPECSHLDPAATAPQCRLCRLLFNASNSIESAVSQAAVAACVFTQTRSFNGAIVFTGRRDVRSDLTSRLPVNTIAAKHSKCRSPCLNCEKTPKKSRRKKRQTDSPPPPRPLVPRLCRTYSIPPYNTLIPPVVNNNNIGVHLQKPYYHHNKLRYPLPKSKVMKDASTQTERRVKVRVDRKQVLPQPKEVKKERSQTASVKKYTIKDDVIKTEGKKIQPRPLSPQFGRCQATTTFFPPKIKTTNPEPTLFKDDLINIISEKHDKKLKILYTSPVQEEYPSIMNLYSPTCNMLTSKKPYRVPPWR